ncbi:MAG TPA: hypothetical protein VK536_06290 [Candidatus Limnocylindrales bacterium]|nr:hypothetical protein [Candidatus Limnocylindrales bacterium]
MFSKSRKKTWQKNKRAITPAISTIIMTAALVVLVLIAADFADNELTLQMAEGEFSSSKDFMQSTGTQIDNVAWTIGRTETVDYTAKYGQVAFAPKVLTYTFKIYDNSVLLNTYNFTTGMILYNMPASTYSIGNNYFSRIIPLDSNSFLQSGVSSPVYQEFVIESIPAYGSFARIVTVPSVRYLTSMIDGQNYYEFYLPSLVSGQSPYVSQSLTLTGNGLNLAAPASAVTEVQITVAAIQSPLPLGFNSFTTSFFNFNSTTATVNIGHGSLVEIYNGQVTVSIGLT